MKINQLKENKKRKTVCRRAEGETEPQNRLAREIKEYLREVEDFQRVSKPFTKQIFKMVSDILKENFSQKLRILISGSVNTDLHTPESNINLLVSYSYKKYDKQKQQVFVNNIKYFVQMMQDQGLAKVSLEEKKFLSIVKLEFGESLRRQKVELTFIYFQNDQQIAKDQQVKKFLVDFRPLKSLYLLTKRMLEPHGLTNPALGGLKSLCLIYLIIVEGKSVEIK